MTQPAERRTRTYIVRVWAEYLDERPPRWCGVIEPVGSPDRIHFADLKDFIDFIEDQIRHHKPEQTE
jgi:hypothetical protein